MNAHILEKAGGGGESIPYHPPCPAAYLAFIYSKQLHLGISDISALFA